MTAHESRESLRQLLHDVLDELIDDVQITPDEARAVMGAFASILRLAQLRAQRDTLRTIPCPPPVDCEVTS